MTGCRPPSRPATTRPPSATPGGWHRASSWRPRRGRSWRPAPIGAIDLFHHGEVIASALDLLGGGTPFRTFFWSHGLSDTGVAALLIGLTGNRGLGTIVLLHAINAALLVATLYVLARGLIRDPLAACLAATLLAATVSYPIIISRSPGP